MLWMLVGDDEDKYVYITLGKRASTMMDRRKVYCGDYKFKSYVLVVVEQLFAFNEFDKFLVFDFKKGMGGNEKKSALVVVVCLRRRGVLVDVFVAIAVRSVSLLIGI